MDRSVGRYGAALIIGIWLAIAALVIWLVRGRRRTLRTLSALPSAQRAAVIERILGDDPDLAPVLPHLLELVARVRYQRPLGPLVRDSVV